MSAARPPELSVVLSTPDSFETIRRTVAWLGAQTARDRLELVIVAPSRGVLELDESALEGFAASQVVEVGEVRSAAAGNAAGVRAAGAPLVVMAEDHSYPQPDWAEALIAAHRGPWAAVGPVVANGNPRTAVSWADFLPGFGTWQESTPGGEADHLPGHNSSYKRHLLLEFGDELEQMLQAESVLHWELRDRGHRLLLEPAAVTRHFNFSKLSIYLRATFLHARTFAAQRARGGRWGIARRLAYGAAWPLIPIVRLRRVVPVQRRATDCVSLPRLLPVVLLGLGVSAVGEATGYLFGPGNAPEKVSTFEFHRDRYVIRRDRDQMARTVPS
jgi:hypothetical protein